MSCAKIAVSISSAFVGAGDAAFELGEFGRGEGIAEASVWRWMNWARNGSSEACRPGRPGPRRNSPERHCGGSEALDVGLGNQPACAATTARVSLASVVRHRARRHSRDGQKPPSRGQQWQVVVEGAGQAGRERLSEIAASVAAIPASSAGRSVVRQAPRPAPAAARNGFDRQRRDRADRHGRAPAASGRGSGRGQAAGFGAGGSAARAGGSRPHRAGH